MRSGTMAAAMAALLLAGQADAAITINVTQVGNDVVTTGSGTFDTTSGLGPVFTGPAGSAVRAESGLLRVGATSTLRYQTGLIGPTLGTGGGRSASSSSGDLFGVGSFANLIYLPENYVSGATLSGTATYLNATISSLGLTPGSFVFRSAIDTITVNIEGTVPEPASWAMLIGGIGVIGAAMRRRRQLPALA